jgi:DNA-binding NtrC family response regulator
MNCRKKNLLVVDDDEGVLKSIREYLTLKGYDVDTAMTGKEAIEKSKDRFYNLAVLDIKLPDIEGTELLIKLHETEPRMIKIMLTGYPSMNNAIDSLNMKADAYLIKPLEMQSLLKVIEQKLKEQEKEAEMDKDKMKRYIESRDKEFDEKELAPG